MKKEEDEEDEVSSKKRDFNEYWNEKPQKLKNSSRFLRSDPAGQISNIAVSTRKAAKNKNKNEKDLRLVDNRLRLVKTYFQESQKLFLGDFVALSFIISFKKISLQKSEAIHRIKKKRKK